jgi:hypothetical protein
LKSGIKQNVFQFFVYHGGFAPVWSKTDKGVYGGFAPVWSKTDKGVYGGFAPVLIIIY